MLTFTLHPFSTLANSSLQDSVQGASFTCQSSKQPLSVVMTSLQTDLQALLLKQLWELSNAIICISLISHMGVVRTANLLPPQVDPLSMPVFSSSQSVFHQLFPVNTSTAVYDQT